MNTKSIAARISLSIAAPVAVIGLLSGCSNGSDDDVHCADQQHQLQQDNSQCDNHAHGYVYFRTQHSFTPGATVTDKDGTFIDPSSPDARKGAGLPAEGPVEPHINAPVEAPDVHPAPEVPEVHISVK